MFFKFLKKRKNKTLQEQYEQNFDMNFWMNLTKQERIDLDFKAKTKMMTKKKALLKSIRDEYIKLKNKNKKN